MERGASKSKQPKTGTEDAPVVIGNAAKPNLDVTLGALFCRAASYVLTVSVAAADANAEGATSHTLTRNYF